jgi:hypothetical protein
MLQRSRTTRSPKMHVRGSVACPDVIKQLPVFFSVLRIWIRHAGTGEANNVTGVLYEVNKQRFIQSPRPSAVTQYQ